MRLREWQTAGLIDAELDPAHAAVALDAMVENSLRWWIGYGEAFDRDTGVENSQPPLDSRHWSQIEVAMMRCCDVAMLRCETLYAKFCRLAVVMAAGVGNWLRSSAAARALRGRVCLLRSRQGSWPRIRRWG